MSIFKKIESDFDSFWDNKIKPVIKDDIEPHLKTFLQQFDSAFGAQAIAAALGAVAKLSTPGAAFATVAADLAETLYTDAQHDAANTAELDATQILTTAQSALAVVKTSTATVTPSDQTAAAAISGAA